MSFKDDPFRWADRVNLTFGPFNLNFFQKLKRLQNTALALALIGLTCWLLFGFDSNLGQPLQVIIKLPEYFSGELQLADLVAVWENYYGKEFHYSAVVIYGLCFYYLSKHFEKLGTRGSRNVAYTSCLTWLSIGVFELYWMGSFSFFQGQTWVLKLEMPQLRIILQNIIGMLSAGGLGVFYMYVESYQYNPMHVLFLKPRQWVSTGRKWRFNWNWLTYLLIAASVATAVLWWFYPGPVELLTVEYETGQVWTNSHRFPQTLYTIDVNPNDGINAGIWHYIENDFIHGLNTLVKIFFTLAIFNIGRIKRVN